MDTGHSLTMHVSDNLPKYLYYAISDHTKIINQKWNMLSGIGILLQKTILWDKIQKW